MCIEKLYTIGDVIVLTLFTKEETGTWLWTTIRRWTPQKEEYYRKLIGMEVEIDAG